MSDPTPNWARAFRIVFPDGFDLDGVQFPTGLCLIHSEGYGLVEAATSLGELSTIKNRPLAEVEWAPEVAPPLAALRDAAREWRQAESEMDIDDNALVARMVRAETALRTAIDALEAPRG